jgi:hypothetical protein
MIRLRGLERWAPLAAIAAASAACAGVLGLDQGIADLGDQSDATANDSANVSSDEGGPVLADSAANRDDVAAPGDGPDLVDASEDVQQGAPPDSSESDTPGSDGGSAPVDAGPTGGDVVVATPDAHDSGGPPPPPDAASSCNFTACPDGCFDTSSDPQHCGSCSRGCPHGTHSEPSCAGGACGIVCTGGALDCDRDPANGCECYGAIANGALLCNANGTCGHVCDQGYVDCGGSPCSCGGGNRCLSDQSCGACRNALQPCGVGSDCCSGSCGVNLTCL